MPEARTPGKGRTARPSPDGADVASRRASRSNAACSVASVPRARAVIDALTGATGRTGRDVVGDPRAWWHHSLWLTVQKITVTGTVALTPEQVREAAGLNGHSTFALDVDGARSRVAALPKVRSVTVTKLGWNAVSIDLEERTPWGSWQINGFNVPIDIDGYVLDTPAPEGSPLIVEIEPKRVINTGDRLDPGAVQLAARLVRESSTAFGRTTLGLVYRQDSGLTAVLSGSETDDKPLWVTFGDSRDYDYKVAALYVLIEQARQSDVALNAVDLRFGDRLTFR
jgi:hypothetical protein